MKRIKFEFIKDVLTGHDSPLMEVLITLKEKEYVSKRIPEDSTHYISLKEVARSSNNEILVDAMEKLNQKRENGGTN